MDATTYFKDKIVQILRGTTFTGIGTLYLAMFTTATTDGGGGTEVTAGGFAYARKAVTLAVPTDGLSVSTNSQSWANHPAAVITHGALMDALTVGNMVAHGPWSSPITWLAAGTDAIAAGDIVVNVQ